MIEGNARMFRELELIVASRAERGRWDSTMGWARIAASFAIANPTGFLRSTEIEQSLAELADGLPSPTAHPGRTADVLHIASELHLVGGHRSMLQRWLNADLRRGRVSDLAVTRPFPVPGDIAAAVAASGGLVHELGRLRPIERARQLRALRAELVISHAHADDPIPVVALGGRWPSRSGTRVVHVDHADHLFAILPSEVTAYACLREPGEAAAVEARGVPREALIRLRTPVEIRPRQVRQRHSGPVTLLALARGIKFAGSTLHPGFADIVLPAIEGVDGVRLVVVGPEPTDPLWSSALERGLVELPGPTMRPQRWLAIADVHLDSIPFGSTTSMLESAARATAILVGTRHEGRSRLLSSDGVLADGVIRATTDSDYADALRSLAGDESLRREIGEAGWREVSAWNSPDAWTAGLDVIDERSSAIATQGSFPSYEPEYALQLSAIQSGAPLDWIASGAMTDLDRRDQVRVRRHIAMARAFRRIGVRPPELARGAA